MQADDDLKSRPARRWMAFFLVVLAIGGVGVALLWSRIAQAAPEMSAALDVQCEMVRVWPLPAECLFVFNDQAKAPVDVELAAR